MGKVISDFMRKKLAEEHVEEIYDETYTYDHMKIITVLAENNVDLTYEDMCFISRRIADLWDASFRYKHSKSTMSKEEKAVLEEDNFYLCKSHEEEGYSQVYALRIYSKIIEEYKEVK